MGAARENLAILSRIVTGGARPTVRSGVRVGIDLLDIDDVARSIAEFGDRYVQRVFTPREIAYCSQAREPAPHYAARFAAKEATVKVLRPRKTDAIDWRSIEVVRATEGWCSLRLRGTARVLAKRAALVAFGLSLTHEARYVAAVVVGERGSSRRAVTRSRTQRTTPKRRTVPMSIEEDIRAILKAHARLSVEIEGVADDADLYRAGMTSHASVNVMLALEGKFDVEFPDRMLRRDAFSSIAAIRSAVEELKAGG